MLTLLNCKKTSQLQVQFKKELRFLLDNTLINTNYRRVNQVNEAQSLSLAGSVFSRPHTFQH